MDARKARELADSVKSNKIDEINVTLTFERLLVMIESAAKHGADYLEFECPRFVLDGSLCDPIFLAKQLKQRLIQRQFTVKRKANVLVISW